MAETKESNASLIRSLLDAGQGVRFEARGRSMSPFIRDGDLLTIVPQAWSKVRRGSVVLYKGTGTQLLCHRVLSIQHEGDTARYLARGDALTGKLESIPADSLLGLAIRRERNGRTRALNTMPARLIGLLWAQGQTLRARIGISLGTWRRDITG